MKIAPGEGLVSLTLTCWRGLLIRGHVLDSAGKPARQAIVSATCDRIWCDARTDAKGRFALGPLVPGEYLLDAQLFEGSEAPSERVTARAGDEGIELRLRAGATLSVVARDPEGRALPAVNVRLVQDSIEFEGWTTASSNDDGRVEFDGILPGAYVLFGSLGHMASVQRVQVAAMDAVEVELPLVPGARIVVRASREESDDVELHVRAGGSLVDFAELDASGETTLVVPPGDVEIELARWTADGVELLQKKLVRTRAGEESRVEFD